MSMKTIIAKLAIFISWALIVWAALGLGPAIAAAYMVFSGRVKPGEPYYLDELAPTHEQAIMLLLIFGVMLAIGFVAKTMAHRWLLITTRSRPTPSARP
jgi:hypothetical protein